MKTYNFAQRSPEWFATRLGIPTASNFGKILTPTGKLSSQAGEYCNKLLSELFLGENTDVLPVKSYWMERGELLEIEARQLYEFKYDIATESVGFMTNDAGTLGASPDCLVGDNGMLEIKCPAPWTHIENMLRDAIDKDYYPQTMGQLYIGEREFSDWMSYHPSMPPVIIRTPRDEPYIKSLAQALADFTDLFQTRKAALEAKGMTVKELAKPAANDPNYEYAAA